MGWELTPPKSTFYIWRGAERLHVRKFCTRVLEEAGVVVTPGNGFGADGEAISA